MGSNGNCSITTTTTKKTPYKMSCKQKNDNQMPSYFRGFPLFIIDALNFNWIELNFIWIQKDFYIRVIKEERKKNTNNFYLRISY